MNPPNIDLTKAQAAFQRLSARNDSNVTLEKPKYVGSWIMQIFFFMYTTRQGRPSHLRSIWRDNVISAINTAFFVTGSCRALIIRLLKGIQLDHCVELQLIYFFASLLATSKWSFSVWRRLAFISSQAWNLQVSFSITITITITNNE